MAGCRWHLSGNAEGEIFRLFEGRPPGQAESIRAGPSRGKRSRAGPGQARPSRTGSSPGLRQSGPGRIGLGQARPGRWGWGHTEPTWRRREYFPPRGNHRVWGGRAGCGLQGLAACKQITSGLGTGKNDPAGKSTGAPPTRRPRGGGKYSAYFGTGPRAGPSRAGPGRAEPSWAEKGRAEPSRATAGLRQAGPGRAGPSRAEQSQAEPAEVGPCWSPVAPAPNISPHAAQGGK